MAERSVEIGGCKTRCLSACLSLCLFVNERLDPASRFELWHFIIRSLGAIGIETSSSIFEGFCHEDMGDDVM